MTKFDASSITFGDSFVFKDDNRLVEDEIKAQVQAELQKQRAINAEAFQNAENIVKQAEAKATQIIESAEKRAEEIMVQAQEEGYTQGKEQGYKEGYTEGFNQIESELQSKVQNVDIIAQSAFELKANIINSAQTDILELISLICDKITHSTLELDKTVLQNIISAAIKEMKEKETVKIIVNPELTEDIYSMSETLKQNIKGLQNIKIVEDKTISKDGVFVESLDSRIDARLSTQVAEITAKLLQEASTKNIAEEIEND